jgi:rubrerythrin
MLELDALLFDGLDTPAGLRRALQQALMLEHATIPTYLYALYSLQAGRNGEIRRLITSIVIEEMSHMALAANLLNAIGGSPRIDAPEFLPTYPGPLPGGVEDQLVVGLEPFSLDVVERVFMAIEEPEEPLEFRTPAADAVALRRTIGDFYRTIAREIETLGESTFTGDRARQLTRFTPSVDLIAVTDVTSAQRAIEMIVEQGEGTSRSPLDPEHEPGHYYRFAEIFHGKRLIRNPQAPLGAPLDEQFIYGGDLIPFDATGVWRLVANPRLSDYPDGSRARFACNAFNYTYTSLLRTLHAVFNGTPHRVRSAVGLMESLKAQAIALTALTLADGSHPGPSFEYQPVSA